MLNMVGNRTQCLFREMWYQILTYLLHTLTSLDNLTS